MVIHMFDLSAINAGKKKPEGKQQQSDQHFEEFVSLMGKFYEEEEMNFALLEKATDHLVSAIELTPNDAELYTSLGYVYYLLEDDAEAKKCIEHAKSLAPDSADIKNFA